jgi:hypothetical protein
MPKKGSHNKRLKHQASSVSAQSQGNRNFPESRSALAEQLRLVRKPMAEYREVFEKLAKS